MKSFMPRECYKGQRGPPGKRPVEGFSPHFEEDRDFLPLCAVVDPLPGMVAPANPRWRARVLESRHHGWRTA